MTRVLLLLSLSLILTACSTTTFTSTWKAPDARALDPKGHQVAAVFISNDESSRREAEDVLAKKLNEQGARGIPAYSVIPSEQLSSMDLVKARLADAGADGAVILRVIDEREKTTLTYDGSRPLFAPYYWHFSSYWGYGWGYPYEPARVRTDTVLRIETLVYSLDRDELLWTGTSRTVNPSRVSKLVAEVAEQAAKQMMKEGLLAKQSRAPERVVAN
jgi:hypothetical protein